jgi:hypothetical protein
VRCVRPKTGEKRKEKSVRAADFEGPRNRAKESVCKSNKTESLHFLFLHLYVPFFMRVYTHVCVCRCVFYTLNKPLRIFYPSLHVEC